MQTVTVCFLVVSNISKERARVLDALRDREEKVIGVIGYLGQILVWICCTAGLSLFGGC